MRQAESGPTWPVWPHALGLAECARINPVFKRIFNRRRATLADCTACGADFVHPVEWSPRDEDNWWMLLRCGACGTSREVTVANAEAELYDRELDRAEDRMRRAADRLSRERLADQAESFATALELDLIGAEDFARPPGGA
jgi:transcription elongation factor Elf1